MVVGYVMFSDFLSQLCVELDVSVPEIKESSVMLKVGEVELQLGDLHPGLSLFAKIGECPEGKREELFLKLMHANYLGQGTKDARIGLSGDEKFLTMSLGMPYEMTYSTFRDSIEDFVNFVLYWRKEVEKFEQEKSIL
jgi:hypothetical protein